MQPKRAILSVMDMAKWKKSQAYAEYMNFINNLNDAAKDSSLTENIELSPMVQNVLNMLETLSKWVDEIPPIQQPQRFGNKAFRDWFARVKQNSQSLLKECLADEKYAEHIEETSYYLVDSFGNETRIDYGTGHEMAFAMFLMCLYKMNALHKEDAKATVIKIFNKYLELARKLQVVYNMEPAGSHGVWSLDDFQFLPFIFGSSQLANHKRLGPNSFVDPSQVEAYHAEYMFMGCIKFILQVKTGPFAEHSNQLWNISSVPSWSKVNGGLLKMYTAEVLDKFPVVQHVLFGSFISINPK